jgi:hypothetical protein
MRVLAVAALVACALSPRYSFLLDPPWAFLTFAIYLLWDKVFD